MPVLSEIDCPMPRSTAIPYIMFFVSASRNYNKDLKLTMNEDRPSLQY